MPTPTATPNARSTATFTPGPARSDRPRSRAGRAAATLLPLAVVALAGMALPMMAAAPAPARPDLAAGSAAGPAAAGQPGTGAAPAETGVFTGSIDAVTVYRGQALVTRVIDVPGGPGLRELVVTGLPEAIVPSSLYGESADGVEVRSVSYRIRPIGEDTRDGVRAAERAIRDAKDAVDAASARLAFLEWQRKYLDKLEGFVAPAAQVELKSGVLNAETLAKLTELVTTQRRSQSDEGHRLALEIRGLQETLQLRERELAVLSATTSRTAREAVVFINAARAGARLRLTYLVNGASWSPSYNLRIASPGRGAAGVASLEYQAAVQQMSGEDWPNVQLTLSTATPALVATGPLLAPLTVALAAPQAALGQLAALKDKSYDEVKRSLNTRQREIEERRQLEGNRIMAGANVNVNSQLQAFGGVPGSGGAPADAAAGKPGEMLSLDQGLNEVAVQSQLLDLISSAKVERRKSKEPVTRQGDEGVSVSYRVSGRTSMPSRSDQQLIQIAQLELPAAISKSATPALTQYIYNEARLTNSSEMVLLAGPAASYVGGEFVGSAGAPTIAAGESFRAGFGIDTSLRASKELVERSESTQGGNRIIEFTYKLTVENFGKGPAAVRLVDRLPSPKGGEIKVTLLSESPKLSDDAEYLEGDRKRNLLQWDVTAPPGASGQKALSVEYRFRIEFDRQMSLTESQ